jgi:Spy/CpxP family protein refolding chaperone
MRTRVLCLAILLSAAAFAQPPRGFYPWWDGPIARDLNLDPAQREQVRAIVRSYRARLGDAHAAAVRAEDALEAAFNADVVDEARAHEAIRELAAARQNVTVTMSEMSLKLRMVLTPGQWRELQRRRKERPFGGGPGGGQPRGPQMQNHPPPP